MDGIHGPDQCGSAEGNAWDFVSLGKHLASQGTGQSVLRAQATPLRPTVKEVFGPTAGMHVTLLGH